WAAKILGLPNTTSFAFVTGSQLAHATALAAARHRLLRERSWQVEEMGLRGAPPLRILTTDNLHESILRAVRLLGLGTRAITYVASDAEGRMDVCALSDALRHSRDTATIVCLQAGDLNTGVFDPFDQICPMAKAANAWVHVDGAFGLWA